MTTFSANHKPLPEFDVDPARIPETVVAARQLPDVTDTVARNLGGWLVTVHAGIPSAMATDTLARYRKILRQLADTGHLPTPPARRRPARYQPPSSEENHPQRIAA